MLISKQISFFANAIFECFIKPIFHRDEDGDNTNDMAIFNSTLKIGKITFKTGRMLEYFLTFLSMMFLCVVLFYVFEKVADGV